MHFENRFPLIQKQYTLRKSRLDRFCFFSEELKMNLISTSKHALNSQSRP